MEAGEASGNGGAVIRGWAAPTEGDVIPESQDS